MRCVGYEPWGWRSPYPRAERSSRAQDTDRQTDARAESAQALYKPWPS